MRDARLTRRCERLSKLTRKLRCSRIALGKLCHRGGRDDADDVARRRALRATLG